MHGGHDYYSLVASRIGIRADKVIAAACPSNPLPTRFSNVDNSLQGESRTEFALTSFEHEIASARIKPEPRSLSYQLGGGVG